MILLCFYFQEVYRARGLSPLPPRPPLLHHSIPRYVLLARTINLRFQGLFSTFLQFSMFLQFLYQFSPDLNANLFLSFKMSYKTIAAIPNLTQIFAKKYIEFCSVYFYLVLFFRYSTSAILFLLINLSNYS